MRPFSATTPEIRRRPGPSGFPAADPSREPLTLPAGPSRNLSRKKAVPTLHRSTPKAGMGPGEVSQSSPAKQPGLGVHPWGSIQPGGYPRMLCTLVWPDSGGAERGESPGESDLQKSFRQLPGSAGGHGPADPRQQQPQPRPPRRRVGRKLFSWHSLSAERGLSQRLGGVCPRGEGQGQARCSWAWSAKGQRALGVNGFFPAPCRRMPTPPNAAARSSLPEARRRGRGHGQLQAKQRKRPC